MLKRLMILTAMLALLLVSFVPLVLAQQEEGEEPPFEPFLGGPEGDDLFISGDQAIGCHSVFAPMPQPSGPFEEISSPVETSPAVDEDLKQLCLENGYMPPNAEMQYGNIVGGPPEIGECFERSPGGIYSAYIGTDGSINQATPAY